MTAARRTPAAGLVAAVLAAALPVALSGCGSSTSTAGDGTDTLVDDVDLTGAELSVGSKSFTEQEILGQITLEVLQAAGATVEDRTGLATTRDTRQALESGATDLYWEYTGTGWLVLLDHNHTIADPRAQFEAVAAEDLRDNGIAWVAPAPADNTYAIAVSDDATEPLAEVETLSDVGDLLAQSPQDATLCVASEFTARADGLPGLERAYGWDLSPEQVVELDQEGLVYEAVARGSVCGLGEVFRTDGRLDQLDLRLLEDDRGFFPPYNPTLTVRQDVLDQYPEIEELFTPIAESLDESTLRALNTRVDVDGEPVEQVARDFLEEEGFVGPQNLSK